MNIRRTAEDLLEFIASSPTPYHAVANMAGRLEASGFRRLDEAQSWDVKSGDRFFVVRNGSSIIAYAGGESDIADAGIRIIGAHTDSPCLKLNPNPFLEKSGYRCLNAEVYGSPLLRTWFDRDLACAGRLVLRDSEGGLRETLVDSKDAVAYIPSIAIHLQRDANKNQKIEPHQHLNPLFGLWPDGAQSAAALGDVATLGKFQVDDGMTVVAHDLNLYDSAPPEFVGPASQFIASARIDNLVSCFAGLRAICEADGRHAVMLACSDHEEVGSVSDAGAHGRFLSSVIGRIVDGDPRVMRRSMLVSADGAHGMHPNYPHKHDCEHAPLLDRGVVVKVNSNQRYATTATTEAVFRNLCASVGANCQTFVSRNDLPCGTTIGPIVASELGIRAIDVGVPQLGMHSIREMAGANDCVDLCRVLAEFANCDLGDLAKT